MFQVLTEDCHESLADASASSRPEQVPTQPRPCGLLSTKARREVVLNLPAWLKARSSAPHPLQSCNYRQQGPAPLLNHRPTKQGCWCTIVSPHTQIPTAIQGKKNLKPPVGTCQVNRKPFPSHPFPAIPLLGTLLCRLPAGVYPKSPILCPQWGQDQPHVYKCFQMLKIPILTVYLHQGWGKPCAWGGAGPVGSWAVTKEHSPLGGHQAGDTQAALPLLS